MGEHQGQQCDGCRSECHGAKDGKTSVFQKCQQGFSPHATEDTGDFKDEIRKKSERIGADKNIPQWIQRRATRAEDKTAENTCHNGCDGPRRKGSRDEFVQEFTQGFSGRLSRNSCRL